MPISAVATKSKKDHSVIVFSPMQNVVIFTSDIMTKKVADRTVKDIEDAQKSGHPIKIVNHLGVPAVVGYGLLQLGVAMALPLSTAPPVGPPTNPYRTRRTNNTHTPCSDPNCTDCNPSSSSSEDFPPVDNDGDDDDENTKAASPTIDDDDDDDIFDCDEDCDCDDEDDT
jgi:hypothetical protein